MNTHKLQQDPQSGNYFVRLQVDGTRKRFYLGRNRRNAEHQLRTLKKKISESPQSLSAIANEHVVKTTPQDLRLSALISRYLAWSKNNRAKRTWETNKGLLQPFLQRYGDCLVSDLNHSTLANYYAWVRKYKSRGLNGGNKHMEQVKALLRWGESMDICENPIRRFPVIRQMPPETKKFTDEELPQLLNACSPDFRDMVMFGLLTGLRPQELRGLRREHIQKVGEQKCVILERHKTSLSAHQPLPRCVPLSPEAVTIIERQTSNHPFSTFVFQNGKGKPYTADVFAQRLKRACVRAGLPKRSPYALRHYFGTRQAGNGLNQAILAQLMGHTTITTTARYVAKVPDYHQKAVNVLQEKLTDLINADKQREEENQSKVIPFSAAQSTG